MLCVWENTHCSIIMDGGRRRTYQLDVAFLYSQEPGGMVKGWGSHPRKPPGVPASCHFLFHQPLPEAFVHMVTRSTCLQAVSPSPKPGKDKVKWQKANSSWHFSFYSGIPFPGILPYRFLLTFYWPELGHLGLPQEARVLGEVIVLRFTLLLQATLRF